MRGLCTILFICEGHSFSISTRSGSQQEKGWTLLPDLMKRWRRRDSERDVQIISSLNSTFRPLVSFLQEMECGVEIICSSYTIPVFSLINSMGLTPKHKTKETT
jgi:hypothetical protein